MPLNGKLSAILAADVVGYSKLMGTDQLGTLGALRCFRRFAGEYVFEGGVRRAGARGRITAQLIDANTGNHIWVDRYALEFESIFAVQDEITSAITAASDVELAGAEQEREHVRTLLTQAHGICTIRACGICGVWVKNRSSWPMTC